MRIAACLLALSFAFTGCMANGETEDPDEEDADRIAESLTPTSSSYSHCADPGVLVHDGFYYVTCTGGGFPILRSKNPKGGFEKVGQIFAKDKGPKWADGDNWAPEIHRTPTGFVAYFTAKNRANGKLAIGAAFSADILGPYVDRGEPLVASTGSKIDSHVYTDGDGDKVLYWKAELFDSKGRQADVIRAQKLSHNGLNLIGDEAKTVLTATEGWEAGVVEAPYVMQRAGWYYMLYSGAYYCNASFGLGVARSRSPLGPFEKWNAPGSEDGRILKSGKHWSGPGHNAIVRGPDGILRTFFHGYLLSQGTPACRDTASDNNQRHLLTARVVFKDGWPRIAAAL
jgi:arabinan endo-1,5-alpha-L-arabinosidase